MSTFYRFVRPHPYPHPYRGDKDDAKEKTEHEKDIQEFIAAIPQQSPSFVKVGTEQVNKAWISAVYCTSSMCTLSIGLKESYRAFKKYQPKPWADIYEFYKECGGKLEEDV